MVAPSGACTATVTPNTGDNCMGTALDAGLADDACASASSKVDSFNYVPNVPTVTCAVTSSATAVAHFTQSLTVCCLP